MAQTYSLFWKRIETTKQSNILKVLTRWAMNSVYTTNRDGSKNHNFQRASTSVPAQLINRHRPIRAQREERISRSEFHSHNHSLLKQVCRLIQLLILFHQYLVEEKITLKWIIKIWIQFRRIKHNLHRHSLTKIEIRYRWFGLTLHCYTTRDKNRQIIINQCSN